MTKSLQTVHPLTSAPVYLAVALTWLALILYAIVGKVIIRETSVGAFLAQQVERLPLPLSKPVFLVLWCLFFLGWVIPLFLGVKGLSRRTGQNVSN
jgi:hypothetical protein